jgi:hypothetical protein
MHVSLFLSLAICVIGLIVYIISTNAKIAEVGRLSFFAGLFVFLMQFGPYIIGK